MPSEFDDQSLLQSFDSSSSGFTMQQSNVVGAPPKDSLSNNNPLSSDGVDVDLERERLKLFDYNQALITLKQIRDQWSEECRETIGRRKTRDVDLDVKALRASGKILQDETIIPVRVIDMNIKREQPAYINYLRNSRRLAIFKCLSDPDIDPQMLEQQFTAGMTYPSWEKPHFKEIDGAETHGWDAIEVVLDNNNPLHVGLEHVGHDKLFFSYDALDIENCQQISRAHDVTIQQLESFVSEFGFSKAQVDLLIATRKDAGAKSESTIRIYKRFFKFQNVVYVSWYALDYGSSDWLKPSEKLFLGRKKQTPVTVMVPQVVPGQLVPHPSILGQTVMSPPTTQMVPQQQMQWQDVDETSYPIFILPYQETEKQRITEHKGRVFLDGGKQEAATAVISGLVNGVTRASNIYASPTVDTNDGGPLKVTDIRLDNGTITNKPVNFWHPEYPDSMVLGVLQYLDTNNASEVGDTTFAAMNRPDARKTAKELSVAEDEGQKLDSVQLTLFSTHIRMVYGFVWLVVQSQAEQGLLPNFMLVRNPDTQQLEQDVNTISQTYDIRAAGDVDVIQKEEIVNQMMQDWPVIQNTALKDTFLADLIKLKYPNDAERYSRILEQGNPLLNLVKELAGVLQQLVSEPPVKAILAKQPPQVMQQLEQLNQQVEQAINPQPQGQGNKAPAQISQASPVNNKQPQQQ